MLDLDGQRMTRAEQVVDRLWDLYAETYSPFPSENIGVDSEQDTSINDGESHRDYWQTTYGGQDAFTCLVRTILSQNTSDKASQPAHDALIDRYGGGSSHCDGDGASGRPRADVDLAESLADAERSRLAETISSAGLYNQKSEILIETAEWVLEEFGSAAAFDEFVKGEEPEAVRETLLGVRGVGPKTADCVLLFAGGRGGVFPVDTHVHRIYRRLGIAPPDADHEDVRAVLERDVPAAKCGFGHTATIQFGREYCRCGTCERV